MYLLITNLYFELFKLNNKERQLRIERLNIEQGGDTIISNSELLTDTSQDKKELKYIKEISGYNVIAELEIPAINLKTDILEQYSEESLKISVTKFFGSNPNDIGNFCISGHNYRVNSNNMFNNLKKIKTGDDIFLTDGYGKQIRYKVYDIFKVFPNETNSLSQKTKGKREVTLITCTSDSQKRIIVKAIEN